MKARRNQQGTTVVEFAVVGVVFFTVMFALIDFSRLFFDMALLDESTRRGARVAAVCPVNDAEIDQVALFSGLLPGLTTANIDVEYLDTDGNVLADPSGGDYGAIRYVRVGIQNFQLQSLIPGLAGVLPMPAFATTIPSESLGRVGTADIPC